MTIDDLRDLIRDRDGTDVVCIYDIPADCQAISTGGFGAVVPVTEIEIKYRDFSENGGSESTRCFCFKVD